ncbi:putative Ig domain-containing protein [Nocardioides stalactiti]|uniref:putative Ig domain-containing protein n=1 Tax=Nocardioides stalactiti TaxID=2755356 RepID=UPI001601F02A|nr:putative Ig domain-containing protein [Nocardioides stalactiti]
MLVDQPAGPSEAAPTRPRRSRPTDDGPSISKRGFLDPKAISCSERKKRSQKLRLSEVFVHPDVIPLQVSFDNFGVDQQADGDSGYLRYKFSADVTFTFKVEAKIGAFCELEDKRQDPFFKKTIARVYGVPITLEARPVFELEIGAKGALEFSHTRTFSIDFEQHEGALPSVSTSFAEKRNDISRSGSIGASIKLGAKLTLFGGVNEKGVKAGLGFSLGLSAMIEAKKQGDCLDVTWRVPLEASLRAEAFIHGWDLWKGELNLFDGDLFKKCFTKPQIKDSLPEGIVGQYYDQRLATEDDRNGTWSIVAPSVLPAGLYLESSTGRVFGTYRGEPGVFRTLFRFVDITRTEATRSVRLDLAPKDPEVQAVLGRVIKDDDGHSWYVDKRASRHPIPSTDVFGCLEAQVGSAIAVRDDHRSLNLPVFEDAECINARSGDILRLSDGESALFEDGIRHAIPDGGTFQCLEANGHRRLTVPRYFLLDIREASPFRFSCLDVEGSKRKIVRADNGSSWYIDGRGTAHWIPSTSIYGCLTGAGVPVTRWIVPRSQIGLFGQPKEEAQCVTTKTGDILKVDQDSYLLNADGTRSSIPDGNTYECLDANGHDVVRVPRYYLMDLRSAPDASFSCYDADRVKGKVVRASDSTSWYIDKRGGRHWIPNGGTFDCIEGQTGGAWPHTVPIRRLTQTKYEDASCVRPTPGNILKVDQDSYLLNADWTRSSIPDGNTYECLNANGHEMVRVPRYYLLDLRAAPDASFNCYDGQRVNGKVVRASDSTSWYIDKRGGRHWIPDGGTFECIAAQTGGAWPHTVPIRRLTQTKYEDAACVRATPGNILKVDQDSYLLNADWTRSSIPDGNTYECLDANGHDMIRVPRYYLLDLRAAPDASYSCYDANQVKGKVVRASDGTSWYIDKRGGRHHIPDGGTFQCIAGQTGGAWPHTVPIRRLTQTKYEDAACVRAKPGDVLKVDEDSYVVNADRSRSWISSVPTFHCIRDRGGDFLRVPRYFIDDMRDAGTAKNCISPSRVEGQVIRRNDGVSWVVIHGERRHIPNFTTDVCARAVHGRTVAMTGLDYDAAASIPESTAKYGCDIEGAIVQAADRPEPYPSYRVSGGTRYWIPDGWTFDYWKRRGLPVVQATSERILQELPDGGPDEQHLDPAAIGGNTIIRRTDGVSWIVDVNKVRHHIPYAQDDVCWRLLRGRPVVATGLSAAQVDDLREDDPWPCIIGDRVVKSSNGTSWFVGKDNKRHHIPDTATFAVLARKYEVVGPWPASEVEKIPVGSQHEKLYDPPAGSIIRRSDGVSWVVDANHVRHHIPYAQDDVCWRLLKGAPVHAVGLSFSQANALEERDKWPCIIGNRVVRSTDGRSYFVGTDNVRHHIRDTETFGELDKAYEVVGPWDANEVAKLPPGNDHPRLINPDSVRNGIMCRNGDGVCWVVDNNAVRHYIPAYPDQFCHQYRWGTPFKRWVDGDQASSLREAEAWSCSVDNFVVDSDADYLLTDGGGTRRWIQDWMSMQCYSEGRNVIRAPQGDVNRIREGAWLPKCLPVYAIRNKVITTHGGYAYLITNDGVWHYITDNWNCIVANHAVYARDVGWDQVKAYGRFNEGSRAECWM